MVGEGSSLLRSHPGHDVGTLFGSDDAQKKRDALLMTSILIQATQVILIVFYGVFTQAGGEISTSGKDFNVGYTMFSGVLIMMVVGFGYLMTFISNYELGSVAFCILVTVLAFQIIMFTEAFFTMIYDASWSYITLDIYDMINSLYAVAAVLISFGAVIGKTTPSQVLIMTILELLFYSFNNRVFQVGILNLADCGGTIVIHMFGAYYGLAVSYMLGLPKVVVKETYTADIFSFHRYGVPMGLLALLRGWIFGAWVISAAESHHFDSAGPCRKHNGCIQRKHPLRTRRPLQSSAHSKRHSRRRRGHWVHCQPNPGPLHASSAGIHCWSRIHFRLCLVSSRCRDIARSS